MSDVPRPPPPHQEKGLFASLFDFSFEHFITPTLLEVGYLVVLILTCVAAAFGTIAAVVDGYLPGLLFSTIGAALWLLFVRVVFEGAALFFSMAADIREIRHRGAGF